MERISNRLRSLLVLFGDGSASHVEAYAAPDESGHRLLDPGEVRAELELELARARRTNAALSVMIGELDDSSGRPSVAVREHAISVLMRHKRQIDIAGSFEDGRFVLVLPETGEGGALTFADRLRALVVAGCGDDGPATISFGVASFGRHGRSASALFSAARRALRAAQALERDRSSYAIRGDLAAAIASVDLLDPDTEVQLETVLALAETVDVRDREASGPSERVGRYSMWIARELGLPEEVVARVRLAGRLHDLGKIGVSRSVLHKPGPLTQDEWQAVRQHPQIGARVLEGSGLPEIAKWVLHHHERPDGEGYPDRLAAGEIPLESRILAVADAYEAMTSERSYAAKLTPAAAREELQRHAGLQFDRRVVEAFARVFDRQASKRTTRAPA